VTARAWFSASLRFTIDVDGTQTREMLSVVLFSALDFEDAFRRALELGRLTETTYLNQDDGRVNWRLVEVATIDMLGDAVVDGREVYCEPRVRQLGPLEVVNPEESRPTQSGV